MRGPDRTIAFHADDFTAAPGPKRRATFRSGSDGLPTSTIQGRWTREKNEPDRFVVAGGHVQGERSWFETDWISPRSAWGPGHAFRASWEAELVNNLVRLIDVKWWTRTWVKGLGWSPWIRYREFIGPNNEPNSHGWQILRAEGGARTRMHFQWRLKATFTGGPSAIRGRGEAQLDY